MTQELEPKALRKVAEAATPGPWVLDGFAEGGCSEGCCEEYTRLSVYSVTNQGEVVASEVRAQRNADYFDAFDPPTVLALLTQLEQAKQDLHWEILARQELKNHHDELQENHKKSEAQVARVRELNQFLPASIMERITRALDGEPNE